MSSFVKGMADVLVFVIAVYCAAIRQVEAISVECPPDEEIPCKCEKVDYHSDGDQQTIVLDCTNMELYEIPDWSFLHSMPVTYINLSHNNIEVIEDGAFAGVRFWKHTPSVWTSMINLTQNPLKEIKSTAFRDITAEALMIHIDKTPLTAIPIQAIENIENLTDLFFRSNNMIDLEEGQFINCKKLRRIDLSGNELLELHPDAFLGLEKSLKTLSLNRMGLTEFPSEALKNLEALWELEVNHNQISALPNDVFLGFKSRSQRFHLELKHNGLTDIAPKAFARSSFLLYELHLEYNMITNMSWLIEPCSLTFSPYAHINLKHNLVVCDGCVVFSILKSGFYDLFGECHEPDDVKQIPWISKEFDVKAKPRCYGDLVEMWDLPCLTGNRAEQLELSYTTVLLTPALLVTLLL